MRESGLADLLPSLAETVWVGVSARSMVMTPRIGQSFVEWPSAPDDRTLGLVDFSIFPHLDLFPTNTLADARRWAAGIDVPGYALDGQSAIAVVDGTVELVSEGRWLRFGPGEQTTPDRVHRLPHAGRCACGGWPWGPVRGPLRRRPGPRPRGRWRPQR